MAPADVPAMYRPLKGSYTCGAKIYHIEPDTARSPIVSARRKGAKVTPRPQRYTEQKETDRRALCGGTIEVGAMYGDCKLKRVGKDFSAFVHAKTAKPFGNYKDCIGGSRGIRRLQRWQKIGRDSLAFDCIGTARVRKPYRDSMRSRVMCRDF